MASFPKLLTRPRLQILVLMLVLLAGLSPKNSMAQDDPAASPDADASPAADGGSTADKASGRAEAGGKKVKCYELASTCAKEREECLKVPDANTPVKECELGCFQDFNLIIENGKVTFSEAKRRCATADEASCLEKKAGMCMTANDGEEEQAYLDCIQGKGKPTPDATDPKPEGTEPKPKGRAYKAGAGLHREGCFCKEDLCNKKLPAASTGAKHLGYNVAVVGALLVSAFPLRNLFLVG